MDIRFDGKTVLVTGAARGIGFTCAELFADSGAKVALVDIMEDTLESSTKKLQQKGEARGYKLDLSKVEDIAPVVSKIRKEMGEIDVLVQAAGLLRGAPAMEITAKDWDMVFNINARGLFFMMQAVVGQSMIPRASGSIVNFASLAGLKGMMEPLCSAHYSGSKGAVVQVTKQAAIEWAKYNIRANAVAPGGVKTEAVMGVHPDIFKDATRLVPLKRLSEPIDIASGVCFLASDAANMITGQMLIIDGGGYAMGF